MLCSSNEAHRAHHCFLRAHPRRPLPPLPPHPRAIRAVSTKTQAEAHGGAGDLGEQKPQKGPQPTSDAPRYEEGKENAHDLADSKDERSIANNVRCQRSLPRRQAVQAESVAVPA